MFHLFKIKRQFIEFPVRVRTQFLECQRQLANQAGWHLMLGRRANPSRCLHGRGRVATHGRGRFRGLVLAVVLGRLGGVVFLVVVAGVAGGSDRETERGEERELDWLSFSRNDRVESVSVPNPHTFGSLIVGMFAKVGWEAATGDCLFVDPTENGFTPVPLAHLVGALVGLAAIPIWSAMTRHRFLSQIALAAAAAKESGSR